MAKLPPYAKLPDEPCLTEAKLFAYLDEQLSPAEQHEAEAHLLDCAMCSDALEGLAMLQDRKAIHALLPLAAAAPVTETIPEEHDSKKVIPLFRRPAVWASAAVVALLLGVTVLLKIGIGEAEKQQVADVVQEEKKQEATAPRADSIAANTMQEPAQIGPTDKAKNIAPELTASEVTEQASNAVPADDVVAPAPVVALRESNAPIAKEETDFSYKQDDAKDQDAEKQQTLELEKNESKKSNTATLNKSRNRSKTAKPKTKSRSFDPPASNAGAARTEEKLGDASGNTYDENNKPSLDSTPGKQAPHPLKASDRDLDLSYTNGVNLLAAGQAQASIAFFDEVIKNPAHPHYDDALWQKSQALLKLNKKVEAKPVLELLVKRNSKYKAQAEEELKKL